MYYQLISQEYKPNTLYYGPGLSGPLYVAEQPETSEANLGFLVYAEQDERCSKLEEAMNLSKVFQEAGQCLDVIGVEEDVDEVDTSNIGFLGFDVLIGKNYSMLGWELRWTEQQKKDNPLLELLESCFRPRLTRYGLVADLYSATLLLECMKLVLANEDGLAYAHIKAVTLCYKDTK